MQRKGAFSFSEDAVDAVKLVSKHSKAEPVVALLSGRGIPVGIKNGS